MRHYAFVLVLISGCSVGPQIIPAVPITNNHLNITVQDGGTISIHELWIEGQASSRSRTTGNEVDSEAEIEADVTVNE